MIVDVTFAYSLFIRMFRIPAILLQGKGALAPPTYHSTLETFSFACRHLDAAYDDACSLHIWKSSPIKQWLDMSSIGSGSYQQSCNTQIHMFISELTEQQL